MTRKQARDAAFKLLYQMQIQKEIPGNILDIYYQQYKPAPGKEYIDDIVTGVAKNLKEIDDCISDLLEGWRIERLSKISLSAIRLSVYELNTGAIFRAACP